MGLLTKGQTFSNGNMLARIAYNNILEFSSTDASATLIPNTWERWTSASGTMEGFINSQSGIPKADYVCIGAHNLGTTGSTITVKVSPLRSGGLGSYVEVGTVTPTDNKPIYFDFTERDCDGIQVTITGGVNREVGVIYAGVALVMQQPIFGGHNPINLQGVTDYRNTSSDTGQFLGRKIRRKGQLSSYSWANLTDDWIRSDFYPFMLSAKTRPFFIKWRPDYYSDEVAFGYTTGDIQPANQGGTNRLMQVGFEMRAHDE